MQPNILPQLIEQLNQAASLEEVDKIKRFYFGTNGTIKVLLKNLGTLPLEKRKEAGASINALRITMEEQISEKECFFQNLENKVQLQQSREVLPQTKKKIGHLHPFTNTIRMMNDIFIKMGYSVMEGPEIESDEYCFQRLNVPPDHPARDMQDTIYIQEPEILLRTQTSSIEARILETFSPPFKVVIPGKVYRNEKVNKSNHFIFHQYQGIVVVEKTSLKDLFGTVDYLFQQMYGSKDNKVVVRFRNKYYPEVEPGVGPDMQCFNCVGVGCRLCKNVGWLEMGGAGMIHPKVLEMGGIDSSKWMGFAFGLGLDRWVMAKYKITDIRTLTGGNLTYKYYENENTL